MSAFDLLYDSASDLLADTHGVAAVHTSVAGTQTAVTALACGVNRDDRSGVDGVADEARQIVKIRKSELAAVERYSRVSIDGTAWTVDQVDEPTGGWWLLHCVRAARQESSRTARNLRG